MRAPASRIGRGIAALALAAAAACGEPPVALDPLPGDPFPGAAAPARARLDQAASRVAGLEKGGAASAAERATAWADLGRLSHALGFHAPARIGYRNAGRLAPRDWRWPYLEGVVENELGGPAAALEALDRALECDPARTAVRVARARALQSLGRLDEAFRSIEEAIRDSPNDATALLFGAQIAAAAEELGAAVERYERLLALQPGANKLYAPLSLLYRRLGRDADADAALARRGDQPATIVDEVLAEVIALAPSHNELSAQGDLAFRAGDLARAESYFREATNLAPNHLEHRLNLAAVLLSAGRGDEARRVLDDAIELDPSSARAWFTLGVLRGRDGDLDGAVAAYRRALEIQPDDSGARQNLANILLRSGRPEAALSEYRRLLARDNSSAAGRVGAAASLLALGRSGEARRELERDFRLETASPHIAGALARILAAAPQAEARDGRRALEIARSLPDVESNPVLLETLAMALAESGDLPGAVAAQERALSLATASGTRAPPSLEPRLEKTLAIYRSGAACREPALF